ncbi:MAG: fibronectin type III domain-containing protein, partial [Ruminiclostridium sp.]|nr:fibronectin type III domain-containing protein [Ruminiclostridium sp.]
TVVNYEMTSEYIHYDSVPLHLAEVERTGLDGDIIYYVLKWISNGTRIYCNSNSTCDGTYGTHGDRSYAWYKMHIYQDKVQIVKNLYSRSSDWGNTIDASANSVSYRFKAKASVVPQNVKATAGNKKVTLSWTEVSGATKYRVQRLNGTTWSTISYPATNSYVDTDVTNGTTYKYRVLAYVNGAWGTASSVVSAKPFNATPQNLKATAGDKNVKLTWTKVSGATKYRVQRLNGTTWSTINYPTANSYTDTGLKNDTTYKYRVLEYVNGAWSTASSAVSAKPFNTTPKNIKATAGDKNVKITWTKVSGATKYRVQRLNGTTWSTVNYPATNSYTDTGLTNGTAYKYRVLAYVNGVWSTASSAVSATPNAVDTIPKNVRAVGANKRVTITWTAVTGATKYRVQRTTGTSWTTVNYSTATTYVDTDVINGTTYKYRVLAYVNGVWSTPSSVVSAIPVSSGGSSIIG